MRPSKKPVIIFDFDGTIADSFEYVLDFLSKEGGHAKPPTGKETDQYRGMPMKTMALKLGVPFWRLPGLYFKGRRVMRAHMEHVKAFEGLPEVIKALHEDGYKLYIVSSNSVKNIRHLLKYYDLTNCFTAVRGNAGLFGKVTIIRQLCIRYRIKPAKAWYVGDELSDIVSARAVGTKTLAVTWGFAARDDIVRIEPTAIADKPADIIKLLTDSR